MAIRNQPKTTHPPTIRAALTEKQCQPKAVLEHIDEWDDVIVGMFNSEPLSVLDALEANAERLSDVRPDPSDVSVSRTTLHARCLPRAAPRLLVPLSGQPRRLPQGHLRSGTQQLQRGALPDAAHHEMLAGLSCGLASGSPRLLLLGHPRRLCGGKIGRAHV